MNMQSVEAARRAEPDAGTLTWGLCVSTLNRIDVLEHCVGRALDQTRRPAEIVIVDASDTWKDHKARIARLAEAAGVPLQYVHCEKRSLAVQRNRGLALLSSDIAFLIDDDAMMRPTCAETIMRLYEADPEKRIASISGTNARGGGGLAVEKKNAAGQHAPWAKRLLKESLVARWFLKEVLMTARDRIFIRYDPRSAVRPDPAAVEALGLEGVGFIDFVPGWGMTVRREVALREPFDNGLMAYCPAEDLDASYRHSRHGINLVARNAQMDHVEVAAGRIKRRQASMLALMNSAYFTRKNSQTQAWHAGVYYVFALRRMFADALKDTMTGRFTYPQFRGTAEGVARSAGIFLHKREGLEEWYEAYQRRLLAR